MAKSLEEKLKKIKDELITPPKLSEVEKKKITETFEALKEILDDTLEVVLGKDRSEAFRYTNLLVSGIQQVDVNFMAGVDPPRETNEDSPASGENDPNETSTLTAPKAPVKKPDFLALTQNLTTRQMHVATKSLSCFKQFEEVGDAIVCSDCSPERMMECIRMEDPTVNPEDDYELDVKNIRGQNNPSE